MPRTLDLSAKIALIERPAVVRTDVGDRVEHAVRCRSGHHRFIRTDRVVPGAISVVFATGRGEITMRLHATLTSPPGGVQTSTLALS
jgi:hypothetical protein